MGEIALKRLVFLLVFLSLLLPMAMWAMQDTPSVKIDVTGINPTGFPTVIINAAVYDRLGQPVYGLKQDAFKIMGELADKAKIVKVENITDDKLDISVVLVIDTSSSMAEKPLDRAKEAAISFVNLIGPKDSVALIEFNSAARLVQDFTTDKEVLLKAIKSLGYGGKTALYDAGVLAAQTAAKAPTSRRAIILLSDGEEYGNLSRSSRGAALADAAKLGVPVYTVGFGFVDRSYLDSLAKGTNAQYIEAPTSDQLVEIYNNLAARLRSQYVITLQLDVPADGHQYKLELQTTTADGSATASTTLRAPIPVPIVTIPDFPAQPISQPTTITAQVAADDTIAKAEFLVDGTSVAAPAAAPYTVNIDPVSLKPGSHSLTFNVTDSSGDTAAFDKTFEVAVLPSTVTINGALDKGELKEPQTITLDVKGQTPAASAAYSLDGGAPATVTTAPYSFTVDPFLLKPGSHTLSVDVVNEGGAKTTVNQTFTVAALPPRVTVTGLQKDQEINAPTQVTINAVGQTPITTIDVSLNGNKTTTTGKDTATVTIDPLTLQPGANQLTAAVTSDSGQMTTISVPFTVAALPPKITITGLKVGETLDANRLVNVEVESQTIPVGAVFKIDGNEVESQITVPYSLELNVLALKSGPHILSVQVTNAGEKSATADTAFTISESPSLTATASVPTATPLPTNTFTPTAAPTNTLPATNTPAPTATATLNGSATAVQAEVIVITQTVNAQLEATKNVQATQNVRPTDDLRATANALATQNADATAKAQATLNAQGTLNARSTADALILATANALSTANALATRNAAGTATAQALNAQGTANALSTANALATLNAQATRTAQAEKTQEATPEVTQAVLTKAPTQTAQLASTPTATEGSTNQTPAATVTPIGTLTAEVQTVAAANNTILPILCGIIALVVVLLVIFLLLRNRRTRRSN
jgi:VWFA-related protein